jgi:hypothetical protein
VNILNFAACFLLLNRSLRVNAAAASAGAAFFAFASPRVSHAGHYNLLAAFMIPAVIAIMIQFARGAATLDRGKAFLLLAAAALCFDVQLLASLYMGWFFALWALFLIVTALIVRSTRAWLLATVRRLWPSIAGAAVVLAAGMALLVAMYQPVRSVAGPRSFDIVDRLTPDGWSLLRMGSGNYVWGDVSVALSRIRPPFSSEHNVGLGVVVSLAWIILTAWALREILRSKRHADDTHEACERAIVAIVILATSGFYAIGMRYPGDVSPWRLVYDFIPGADGLRGVARYVLFLALPMAVVLSLVLDRAMKRISDHHSPAARRPLAMMTAFIVSFGLLEQFGRSSTVSSRAQISRLSRIASALPEDCTSFYAAPHPLRRPIKYEYQIDAMLISAMKNVPTLNGYSGHVPPGWTLREVEAPDYEQRVARWLARHRVGGKVCRLEIGD